MHRSTAVLVKHFLACQWSWLTAGLQIHTAHAEVGAEQQPCHWRSCMLVKQAATQPSHAIAMIWWHFLPRVKTLPSLQLIFCFNLITAEGNNENNGSWTGKIPLPRTFTQKKCLSFLTIWTFPRSFGALNMENSAFNNKSLLINFDSPKSIVPYTC